MFDFKKLFLKQEELKLALTGCTRNFSNGYSYSFGCSDCSGSCSGSCDDTCSGNCTGCGDCGSN